MWVSSAEVEQKKTGDPEREQEKGEGGTHQKGQERLKRREKDWSFDKQSI